MPARRASIGIAAPYRTRALQLAKEIRTGWERSPHQDPKSLLDDVQTAFAEEANHELRQILFQLSAQLELILVKGNGGEVAVRRVALTKMLAAVARAAGVVEAYLDRGEAAKMVIDPQVASFDLGAALVDLLRWNDLYDRPWVEISIDPVEIDADRQHLMDVLGHMASRFCFSRRAPERVRITLIDQGDQVEGFFGLVGSQVPPQELMAEFDRPLEMDDMHIDMPYTRAVIERHGGTLYVAAGPENASGFGFTLPVRGKPQ